MYMCISIYLKSTSQNQVYNTAITVRTLLKVNHEWWSDKSQVPIYGAIKMLVNKQCYQLFIMVYTLRMLLLQGIAKVSFNVKRMNVELMMYECWDELNERSDLWSVSVCIFLYETRSDHAVKLYISFRLVFLPNFGGNYTQVKMFYNIMKHYIIFTRSDLLCSLTFHNNIEYLNNKHY